MNHIQQAISALTICEVALSELSRCQSPECKQAQDEVINCAEKVTSQALTSLRSLQKEVEGVELPKADFFLDGGSTPCWYESSVRSAVAAALRRGAVPQKLRAALEHVEHIERRPGASVGSMQFHGSQAANLLRAMLSAAPSPEATQPTQAEPCPAPGEHSCQNRLQCFEPCGALGHDVSHAKPCDPALAAQINEAIKPTQAEAPSEPWKTSYGVRVGRDNADCIDLIFTKVAAKEFALYPNEAAYLRDLLNAADIPGFPGKAEAPSEREAWDGKRAYHEGRAAYEASVGYFLEGRHKQFWELTSIQQAEFVAKAATRAALATQQAEPSICQACGSTATRYVPNEATDHPGAYCDECGPGATRQAVQAEPAREPAPAYGKSALTGLLWNEVMNYAEGGRSPTPARLKEWAFQIRRMDATPPAPGQVERDREDAERWRWLGEHIGVSWDEDGFTSLVRIVSEAHRTSLNACIDRMRAGDWSDAAIRATRSSEGGGK